MLNEFFCEVVLWSSGVGWRTCVNARCKSVSEVKLWRLCWRERARACNSNGRAVAKPDESQWSSAEASITLNTNTLKSQEQCRFNKISNIISGLSKPFTRTDNMDLETLKTCGIVDGFVTGPIRALLDNHSNLSSAHIS